MIIIADSIDGNNHFIRSNGITALNSVSDAGAGGGGAGGSVALSFQVIQQPGRDRNQWRKRRNTVPVVPARAVEAVAV